MAEGPPAPPPPVVDWQRLDTRMLLVHPVSELIKFLPVLIGLFVASTATDRSVLFQLMAVAVPILIGLVRYWTTRFRISDERIELERGLVSRHAVSTPLDRVRTVDLTASPIHRLLGLSTVRIGTGSASEDGLDLDGLATGLARELRARLLHSIAPLAEADEEDETHPGGERVVARFEPGWLRYAPFTSAGLVLTAGVIGVGSQVLDGLGLFDDLDPEAIDRTVTDLGALVALPALLLGVLAIAAVVSVLGYVVTNGNFALSHTLPDGSWHLRRGLLTTRETSVDDDRMRGVSVGEPLGLRLAGGARLAAIVTGLDRSQSGSETLLPPTPRPLVDRVAAEVISTSVPLATPLESHGSRARHPALRRALVPAGVVGLALAGLVVALDWPDWLLLAPRGRCTGRARARPRPCPCPRPRPRRGLAGRPLRQPDPASRAAGDRRRDRLEPPARPGSSVAPAWSRWSPRPRVVGSRSACSTSRAGRGGGGRRRCPRAGLPVPRVTDDRSA